MSEKVTVITGASGGIGAALDLGIESIGSLALSEDL